MGSSREALEGGGKDAAAAAGGAGAAVVEGDGDAGFVSTFQSYKDSQLASRRAASCLATTSNGGRPNGGCCQNWPTNTLCSRGPWSRPCGPPCGSASGCPRRSGTCTARLRRSFTGNACSYKDAWSG